MQRLVLAALLVAIVGGAVAVLALGLRATVHERGWASHGSEGSAMQKLAFAALVLLIAGVSTGLLGGL